MLFFCTLNDMHVSRPSTYTNESLVGPEIVYHIWLASFVWLVTQYWVRMLFWRKDVMGIISMNNRYTLVLLLACSSVCVRAKYFVVYMSPTFDNFCIIRDELLPWSGIHARFLYRLWEVGSTKWISQSYQCHQLASSPGPRPASFPFLT